MLYMRALKITVFGDVQGVGYRQFVWSVAINVGIFGSVRNLKNGAVEIIAQGDSNKLDEFLTKINTHRYPIDVKKMEIEEISSQNFDHFEIVRGDTVDELGERLDVAGKYMYKMMFLQEQMLQKQDQMLQKQDQMLQKQDLTIETINKFSDKMLQKQDETLSAINNLSYTMSQKFDALDVKYGSISKNLEKINHTLEKLIEKLS